LRQHVRIWREDKHLPRMHMPVIRRICLQPGVSIPFENEDFVPLFAMRFPDAGKTADRAIGDAG
jgi:hypothetical protein